MILFLNSIAGSEIVVILLFVLMFFGAKSIPGMARNMGRGIRQIKNASQDIQDEIRKTSTDMRNEMNINRTINETKEQFEKPLQDFNRKIEASTEELKKNVEISPKKPATPPESIAKNKIEKELEKPKENSNTTKE
ncbi:MAG: twin-arginine translocase TatA/TatE family subunit [Brumimicrobium sp.]